MNIVPYLQLLYGYHQTINELKFLFLQPLGDTNRRNVGRRVDVAPNIVGERLLEREGQWVGNRIQQLADWAFQIYICTTEQTFVHWSPEIDIHAGRLSTYICMIIWYLNNHYTKFHFLEFLLVFGNLKKIKEQVLLWSKLCSAFLRR
jgi:hypothetical protein